MRLTVKEPKIELYEDGFDDNCKLGRKQTGAQLSKLVEDFDESLVIALDGAWGSGKSFFLKCWVGQHLKDHEEHTQTVYFDAFQHDYLDDPLIALTDAIVSRFEKNKKLTPAERADRIQKLKKFGWVLGKTSAKIGASVAGHYAKKLVGDECLEEFGKELEKASKEGVATVEDEVKTLIDSGIGNQETESFWREQRAKIVAMSAFREALVELTQPDEKDHPSEKLVVVVDELDRCRPDYALSLLEIIKHFFAVDGVHFVLGVNLKELQNSVKARYGVGVDAALYLQKFYHISVPLPTNMRRGRHPCSLEHYGNVTSQLGTSNDWRHARIEEMLNIIPSQNQPSLRDVERMATLVAVCPVVELNGEIGCIALAMLTILHASKPNFLRQALDGKAEVNDLLQFFGLTAKDQNISNDRVNGIRSHLYWLIHLTQAPIQDVVRDVSGYFQANGLDNLNKHKRTQLLPDIFNRTLGTFNLPG